MTWDKLQWKWLPGGQHHFTADFAACVRTASKYDDLHLLRLPKLKMR